MSHRHKLTDEVKQQAWLDAIFWIGQLVWAGVVFWMDSVERLPQIGSANEWSWVFLGAGAYGLLCALIRQTSPALSEPEGKDYLWPTLLVIVGVAGFLSWKATWPIIVLLMGAAVLGWALFGR